MVTRRSAKNKGSQMEIDSEHSLRATYPDIRRMGGEGQYLQYDLRTDEAKTVFECKRRYLSWNELMKLYKKLSEVRPEGYNYYILFKGNFQPCLVFDGHRIVTFSLFFGKSFIKHTPVRRNENVF